MDHNKRVFGIRCSNTDFAFAILTGSRSSPELEECKQTPFPKGYSRPQSLKWFFQELQEVTRSRDIARWAMKGAEPKAQRNSSFVQRVEYEGVAVLVASHAGIDDVPRKIKATIAKDLGLPGKAKSLTTLLNTGAIPGFREHPEKIQEAILVAWSSIDNGG